MYTFVVAWELNSGIPRLGSSLSKKYYSLARLLPQKLFSCSSYGSDFEIFGLPVKRPFQKCILCSLANLLNLDNCYWQSNELLSFTYQVQSA